MTEKRSVGRRFATAGLATLLLGLLAAPAAAQVVPGGGEISEGLRRQREFQEEIVNSGSIEIHGGDGAVGRTGRLQLGSYGNGSVLDDPILGRRDGDKRAVWVSYRGGAPFELYEASYSSDTGYWTGTVHALATSSDLVAAGGAQTFRAQLGPIVRNRWFRLGGSKPPEPPPLVDPPGLAPGQSAHPFGQRIERSFPIMLDGRPRGWMVVNVAANGAVTGFITNEGAPSSGGAIPYHPLVGFYHASTGRLAVVRLGPAAAGRPPRPFEALTGVLADGVLFAGSFYNLVPDPYGSYGYEYDDALERSWRVGEAFEVANYARGGCLGAPGHTTDNATRVTINPENPQAIVNSHPPCADVGPSKPWALVAPVRQSDELALLNLYSGLCLTLSGAGDPTLEPCFTTPGQGFRITDPTVPFGGGGVASPNRIASGLPYLVHFAGTCAGVFGGQEPWVVRHPCYAGDPDPEELPYDRVRWIFRRP